MEIKICWRSSRINSFLAKNDECSSKKNTFISFGRRVVVDRCMFTPSLFKHVPVVSKGKLAFEPYSWSSIVSTIYDACFDFHSFHFISSICDYSSIHLIFSIMAQIFWLHCIITAQLKPNHCDLSGFFNWYRISNLSLRSCRRRN